MRRKMLASALWVAVVSIGCPPPSSREYVAPAQRSYPDARGEAVSGCAGGALLVKAVITLTRGGSRGCQADLSPALVCVAPGGVIRWKVRNECEPLPGSKDAPALRLSRPVLRDFAADPRKKTSSPGAAIEPPSIFTACGAQIDSLASGESFLYCTVHDEAPEGIYKYGLAGEKIDPLDPDVEVRPPK